MGSLREVLTDHYQRHGDLVPRTVWEESRPKTAPLHNRFEWDNKVASDAYRDIQAADLIRSVKIRFDTPDAPGERKWVRAFSSARGNPDKTGYEPTEDVLADPLAAKLLLRECQREIADLRKKYGHLEEFAALLRRELDGMSA